MSNKRSLFYKLRRKLQVLAYNMTSPIFMTKIYYRICLGKKLNLENPQTFNEKLNWLKIYEWPNNDLVIKCSDKYLVREYLKEKNMEKYLNELYGVYNDPEEIDFEKFPNEFVLKCNHGCGYNIICDNKNNIKIDKVKKQLKKWLKEDFGKFNAEAHYNKINHKIICEKFLGNEITDYKFYCFNGKVEFMYIASGFGLGINEQMTFFDKNGKIAPYQRNSYNIKRDAELPIYFNEMKKLSEELAKDFPFVRVDWFETENKIYFSELTFTPSGGFLDINPEKYDLEWGKLLDINLEMNKYKK